jgi:hypothetical protein
MVRRARGLHGKAHVRILRGIMLPRTPSSQASCSEHTEHLVNTGPQVKPDWDLVQARALQRSRTRTTDQVRIHALVVVVP